MATARRLIGNIRGPQGAQGIQGEQGIQGPTGPTGATGPAGPMPVLSVGTVTDLPAGSSPTVGLTGTSENPVLNFGIPHGLSGNETIDDTAGEGDVDLVWSADKLVAEKKVLLNDIDQKATAIYTDINYTPLASFTDGADDMPLKSLQVAIEPVQDLHGYDNPWPAGGGVNKFNPGTDGSDPGTLNGITFAKNADGSYSFSGTATKSTWFNFGNVTLPAGTWTASVTKTGSYTGAVSFGANSGAFGTYPNLTNYPKTVTSESETTGVFGINFATGVAISGTLTLWIQIESGSSATAWTPYSNICPISGWTGAKVWDDPVYAGTIWLNQKFPLKNENYVGTNFTASFDGAGCLTVDVTATASATNANNMSSLGAGTWIKGHIYAFIGGAHGISFRLKSFGKAIDSVFRVENLVGNNISIIFTNLTVGVYKVYPMIIDLTAMFGEAKAEEILSLGETAGAEHVKSLLPKEYYPYNVDGTETCISAANGDPHRHIEVEFPTEAGTVYGGTLDVTTGELVVDRANIDMGQSANNYVYYNGYFTHTISDCIGNVPLYSPNMPVCEIYKSHKSDYINQLGDMQIMYRPDGTGVYLKDSRYTDGAELKSSLNGVHLVYELATPITYQLTPQQVCTLLGINNIWADAGDVSVTYPADTAISVDNVDKRITTVLSAMVAPVLTDMIADTALAVNQFRIVNDTLYKVTAPIASGGMLTPGTNVTATSIGEQITALLNA